MSSSASALTTMRTRSPLVTLIVFGPPTTSPPRSSMRSAAGSDGVTLSVAVVAPSVAVVAVVSVAWFEPPRRLRPG